MTAAKTNKAGIMMSKRHWRSSSGQRLFLERTDVISMTHPFDD